MKLGGVKGRSPESSSRAISNLEQLRIETVVITGAPGELEFGPS